jgi:hypothetical protein
MMDRMIFERGNAAVRSESLRPDERWVAVDKSGLVEAYSERPGYGSVGPYWYSSLGRHRPIGYVGEQCPDWRDLLFKVKPPVPIVSEEIWAALKTLHGEPIAGVAWDRNGRCYAHRETPLLHSTYWGSGIEFCVATLDGRWTGDWRDSWTPRPPEVGDLGQSPPEIDPAIWAGLDALLGEPVTGVAWDDGGSCWAYTGEKPAANNVGWWGSWAMCVPVLDDKWVGDWKESWIPRPDDDS